MDSREGASSSHPDSVSEESYGTLGGPILGAGGQEEGWDGLEQTFVVGEARGRRLRRGSGGAGTTWLEAIWGRSLPPPPGANESKS